MKPITSPILHKWPPVWQEGESFKLSFLILTPFGLRLWDSIILKPLLALWKFALLVLILDFAMKQLQLRDILYDTPLSDLDLQIFCVTLFGLWFIDRQSRLSITRFLAGKRIRISASPEEIILPGIFRKRRIDRTGIITFSHHSMGHSQCQFYSNSAGIYLIQDDTIQYKVVEVFDHTQVSDIVSNLNATLALDGHAHNLDIDPMRQRSTRPARQPSENM